MRVALRVDVLDYREFDLVYRGERAHKADAVLFSYEKWSRVRESLIQHLGRIGTPDSTGYGSGEFIKVESSVEYDGGDFIVGDDWFELGIFAVLVLHSSGLSVDLLKECKCFMVQNPDFVLRIEKASFTMEDMFELIITPTRCYIGFFDRTAKEAWTILQHQQYDKIRSALRLEE